MDSITKIYKIDLGLGNGTRTYYIEATPEGTTFIIRIYCMETDKCYIGTFSPASITQNPSLTVKGVLKMLSNALVYKTGYYIIFWLDNFYIQLRFTTEIFDIIQDINLDTNVY